MTVKCAYYYYLRLLLVFLFLQAVHKYSRYCTSISISVNLAPSLLLLLLSVLESQEEVVTRKAKEEETGHEEDKEALDDIQSRMYSTYGLVYFSPNSCPKLIFQMNFWMAYK